VGTVSAKMENTLVHIITPTYKRPEKLKRAVNSVLKQTHSNFVQHIVADGHDEAVANYVRGLKDPRILYDYVDHAGPGGGKCRIKALDSIKSTDKEYICFLDDDNTMYPEFISKHLENLENCSSEYGISVCQIFIDTLNQERFPNPADITETSVKHTFIDTLNFFVRADLAKPHANQWLTFAGRHDFEFINAVLKTTKLKFFPEVLGSHGDKVDRAKHALAWLKKGTHHEKDCFRVIVEENEKLIQDFEMVGRTVIDIGANVGIFSCFCAYLGAKEVIAVEPVKASFMEMCKNMLQFGNTGVFLPVQRAVTDKDGEDIFISYDPDVSVNSNIFENSGELVNSISLNSLLKLTTANNIYLKIDCEGAEYDIILNASKEDMQRFNEISIEIHSDMHPKYKGYELIYNKLVEFGFHRVDTKHIGMWYRGYDNSMRFEPMPLHEDIWKR
jgi:FkbM family methyltransferase